MTFLDTRNAREAAIVLIADDDLFIRTLVRKFIGEGPKFVEVDHGDALLNAYRLYNPDIVFLDMHMPGKDGKELLQELLIHDSTAHVIIITADGSRDNVSASVIGGAKGFMVKPLDSKRVHVEYVRALKDKPKQA